MNKSEVVTHIANKTELSKADIERVLDAQEDAVHKALGKKGTGEIVISGLGKLKRAKRAARQGRNPKTGETVQIAAKNVVKFSPASSLKAAV